MQILPAVSPTRSGGVGNKISLDRHSSFTDRFHRSRCALKFGLRRGKVTPWMPAAFEAILGSVGVKAMQLPPRSPNLDAHCERWIKSVKTEALLKRMLFGERSLRHGLGNYVTHFHTERNHQGKGNVILFPAPADRIGGSSGAIRTRERLGGLLRFHYREAA